MAGCGCNHPFIKKNTSTSLSAGSPPLSAGSPPLALAASPDGLGSLGRGLGEDVAFTDRPVGIVTVGALIGLGLVGAAYAYHAVAKR